jgi:hypothetical protein
MADHRRDGLLAVCALGVLFSGLLRTSEAAALVRPGPALVGIGGALAIEVVFLRSPALAAAWERPITWAGATVATILLGGAALWIGGAVAVAAVCWGLVAYLGLLVAVVVGGQNPLAAVLDRT